MRPRLGLALAAAALLIPGCFEPTRVVVDPDALAASPHPWTITNGKLDSEGALGAKSYETRYSFVPDSSGPAGGDPPFPGVLQVFSLREFDRRSTDALMEFTESIVADAVERQGIELDASKGTQGTRVIASGVHTRYFTLEGTVTGDGELFARDVVVRILGEVGHDGKSKTSFVVVGLAQVQSRLDCPLIGPCQFQDDLATWNDLVADPEGTIGAFGEHGFVDNLVTR